MKNSIEKNLTDAVTKMIPEDMYERIEERLEEKSEEKEVILPGFKPKKISYIKRSKFLVTAACALFIVGLFGNSYYTNNIVVDSIIDFDLNPSIELITNKKDVVLEANAINGDGFEVLDGMDLAGVDLDVAVNAIIGSMLQQGYMDGIENYILVSVQNEDEERAEEIKQSIVDNINATLAGGDLTASVIDQTMEMDEAIEAFADVYGISIGKATFIWNLVEEDSSLDAEELAKYSISEIMEIINAKLEPEVNIEDGDSVEVDDDDDGEEADDDTESQSIATNNAVGGSTSNKQNFDDDEDDEDDDDDDDDEDDDEDDDDDDDDDEDDDDDDEDDD